MKKTALHSWKQIPTVALAGCTLANAVAPHALSLPNFGFLPTRTDDDGSASMPGSGARSWPGDITEPTPFLFQRDYILGTSFDLVVWATHAQEAALVESVILAEIDRLSRILSRYDSQSEVSQLNAGHSLFPASPDLIAILRAYEIWTPLTGGALSARLGGVIDLWKTAEATGTRAPTASDLAAGLDEAGRPGWKIDPQSGSVDPLGRQFLNLDCLGKGYILQKAMEAARIWFPRTWGMMLNIGGDICVRGHGGAEMGAPWRIFCADPRRPYDNALPLTSINISQGSVATSAAYERGFTVAGKRHSHIIDPRSGRPAEGVASATAVARDSLTANALATALCVLKPPEGLRLLEMIEGAEALIIAMDGTQFRTPGFGAIEAQVSSDSSGTNAAPAPSPPTSAPSPSASPDTNAATASVTPLAPGQIVTINTSDQVSFEKGASRIKRPVRPEETFTVMSVDGENVTVDDRFGNEATLNSSVLKLVPAAGTSVTPTPAGSSAATSAATNAVTPPLTNPATSAANAPSTSAWPAGYQVTLGLELPPPPKTAQRIKRPYVAIWVEDAGGKPVRSITVWGTQQKWLPQLSNWWKIAHGQSDLISQTTRATRDAGKYQVVWDGLDDAGKPVARGTYNCVLEVNREFGGHEMHRSTIDCSDSPSQGTIPGATEFLDCPIAYGPPPP